MARKRNREPGLWGILGFFSGILTVLILAVIGSDDRGRAPNQRLAQNSHMNSGSALDEFAKLKSLLDSNILTQKKSNAQKEKTSELSIAAAFQGILRNIRKHIGNFATLSPQNPLDAPTPRPYYLAHAA